VAKARFWGAAVEITFPHRPLTVNPLGRRSQGALGAGFAALSCCLAMTGTVIGGSVRLFCLELRDRTLCVAPCVGL
jgi:hypothetical protein